MPKFGVIRFAISADISLSRPSRVSIEETVGSDNSSFMNGSSVARVAGKNRAPAKPCPLTSSAGVSAAARNIKTATAWDNFIGRLLQNLFRLWVRVHVSPWRLPLQRATQRQWAARNPALGEC